MVFKSPLYRTPNATTNNAIKVARIFLRIIQLVLALVIAGIYGQDLHQATTLGEKAESRWVWAEVVAGFSAITAIVYMMPFVRSFWFWAWDMVLFLFWMVLFGIFGKLYIQEDCEGNEDCRRMKVGVWFACVGMVVWAFSAGLGAFLHWRERRSLFKPGSVV